MSQFKKIRYHVYYSLLKKKFIPTSTKSRYKHLKRITIIRKSSAWVTQIKETRKKVTRQPTRPFIAYSPEPDISGYSKIIFQGDIVSVGGIAAAFDVYKLDKKILSIKRRAGYRHGLSIGGYLTKDKFDTPDKSFPIRQFYVDKGKKFSSVIDDIKQHLVKTFESRSWVVSRRARKNRDLRGTRPRKIFIEIRYFEEKLTGKKGVKHGSKKKAGSRSRHGR